MFERTKSETFSQLPFSTYEKANDSIFRPIPDLPGFENENDSQKEGEIYLAEVKYKDKEDIDKKVTLYLYR